MALPDGFVRPRVGQIVHVPLDRGVNTGQCRPAMVVRVWGETGEMINVLFFTDNVNDHPDFISGSMWLTSVRYAAPTEGVLTPQSPTWHYLTDEDADAGSADEVERRVIAGQHLSSTNLPHADAPAEPEVPEQPGAVADATAAE